MLPASTNERTNREVNRGRPGGRTQEIQRLIGRSLRSVTDLSRLGERTITIDCDVLQADAGTRTASITGGYVALAMALRDLPHDGRVADDLLSDSVAAVSASASSTGEARLDLCYEEDAGADVDFNVVMTGSGELVEVQGTAEGDAVLPRAAGQLARSGRRRHRGAHHDPAAGARRQLATAPWPSRTPRHRLSERRTSCASSVASAPSGR